MSGKLNILNQSIRAFAEEREWEQFHSPKNLAMALSVEVAELQEHFLWLTQAESRDLTPEKLSDVEDEIGDVVVYLLRLCDVLGIDPILATTHKMVKNGVKYPVEKSRGNAKKYTEL